MLDYNFQFGRLKALQFISHKFKEESDRIVEETKLKIKNSRDTMENIDLKLIRSFYSVIHKKRIQNQYFNVLGQLKFSKCASKGLEVSFLNEYLIESMLNVRLANALMNYSQVQKKARID